MVTAVLADVANDGQPKRVRCQRVNGLQIPWELKSSPGQVSHILKRHKLGRADGASLTGVPLRTGSAGGVIHIDIRKLNHFNKIGHPVTDDRSGKSDQCSVDFEPRSWSARRNVALLPTAVDSIGDRTVRTNLQ